MLLVACNRKLVFGAVCLLSACASAQAPPASRPILPAPAAGQPHEPEPRLVIPATHLEGGPGLLQLCDVLQGADGIKFSGNVVEQASQRDLHEQRRTQAAEARYEITVPNAGFAFDGYDLREGTLRLSDKRFSIEDGSDIDRSASDEAIGFVLTAAAADVLLRMHNEGSLRLRLVFAPQASQMRPDICIRQSGGRIIKLGAQVLAVYVVGTTGAPLARYETEAFAQQMAEITPVQTPAVRVGKAVPTDATPVTVAVQTALEKLEPTLLACYREALGRRNTTQGTLILGGGLSKDGRVAHPRMEMSTITDEGLVTCAVAGMTKMVLPTSSPLPSGVSLPITFGDAAK